MLPQSERKSTWSALMARMLGIGGLLLSALLVLPEFAQGQKKDPARNPTVVQASAQDYKNIASSKEVTGIVASADSKSLTFRQESSRVEPNLKNGKAYGVKVVKEHKEYTFDVDSAVVVKKKFVAPEYDDKGNFVVNQAQSKELKAKGFIASKIEDIRSGNVATIVLAKPKPQDKDAGAGNVPPPVVKSINLIQEGTPVASSKAPEKKKKN